MVGSCYSGPIADGERRLAALRGFRRPLADLVGPSSYVGLQSALDSTVAHGWHYYWKSTHLSELEDDLIDVIDEHAFSCASPRSYVALFHLKGTVSRIPGGQTAFGNRTATHAMTVDAVWRSGEDFGDSDTAWTRRFFAALEPYRRGVYVNFLGADENPLRVREAYGDVYQRLVNVKAVYDPGNVFHYNQNIRPELALASGTS
jgi:hypothetical protein